MPRSGDTSRSPHRVRSGTTATRCRCWLCATRAWSAAVAAASRRRHDHQRLAQAMADIGVRVQSAQSAERHLDRRGRPMPSSRAARGRRQPRRGGRPPDPVPARLPGRRQGAADRAERVRHACSTPPAVATPNPTPCEITTAFAFDSSMANLHGACQQFGWRRTPRNSSPAASACCAPVDDPARRGAVPNARWAAVGPAPWSQPARAGRQPQRDDQLRPKARWAMPATCCSRPESWSFRPATAANRTSERRTLAQAARGRARRTCWRWPTAATAPATTSSAARAVSGSAAGRRAGRRDLWRNRRHHAHGVERAVAAGRRWARGVPRGARRQRRVRDGGRQRRRQRVDRCRRRHRSDQLTGHFSPGCAVSGLDPRSGGI